MDGPVTGRAASGQATRASHEAPAGLHHTASVLRALLDRCQQQDGAEWAEISELFEDVYRECYPKPSRIWVTDNAGDWTPEYSAWQSLQSSFYELLEVQAFFDAALALLDKGNDWRRFTPVSMSVFAASPYNAAAQVRYDGYGKTPALQLCAAFLKMKLAPIEKAIATEARRVGTVKQGPVHEGAGRDGIAQNPADTSGATP